MSSLLLKFRGRAFWSKHIGDIWVYHLGYLIEQTSGLPDWIVRWGTHWKEMGKARHDDWMFASMLDDIQGDEQVELLANLSRQLLIRFNNYELFIDEEREITVPDSRHWKMINEFTLKNFHTLQCFGQLFIALLTGDNWHPAYFDTYAIPHRIESINYLEQLKSNGLVSFGYIDKYEVEVMNIVARGTLHGAYWISQNNSSCELEYIEGGVPRCSGIPDLMVNPTNLIVPGVDDVDEEINWDEFEGRLAQKLGLLERWLLDFSQQQTLVILTTDTLQYSRYAANEDFYSGVLKKKVNLNFIYQIPAQ